MDEEPQIRAWKWIEPPFIPLLAIIFGALAGQFLFGGWTLASTVATVCILVGGFAGWAIGKQRFYKKHERVIVAWELHVLQGLVRDKEYFLANNAWPSEPEQERKSTKPEA